MTWANHLTSLWFTFLISVFKRREEVNNIYLIACLRIKWINISEVLVTSCDVFPIILILISSKYRIN